MNPILAPGGYTSSLGYAPFQIDPCPHPAKLAQVDQLQEQARAHTATLMPVVTSMVLFPDERSQEHPHSDMILSEVSESVRAMHGVLEAVDDVTGFLRAPAQDRSATAGKTSSDQSAADQSDEATKMEQDVNRFLYEASIQEEESAETAASGADLEAGPGEDVGPARNSARVAEKEEGKRVFKPIRMKSRPEQQLSEEDGLDSLPESVIAPVSEDIYGNYCLDATYGHSTTPRSVPEFPWHRRHPMEATLGPTSGLGEYKFPEIPTSLCLGPPPFERFAIGQRTVPADPPTPPRSPRMRELFARNRSISVLKQVVGHDAAFALLDMACILQKAVEASLKMLVEVATRREPMTDLPRVYALIGDVRQKVDVNHKQWLHLSECLDLAASVSQ